MPIYRCATCKIRPANPDKTCYNIPFCSEECYDKHSPACGGCAGKHWAVYDPNLKEKN